MIISRSRLTSQNQVSVPAEIRKKLGLAPGSVLAWSEEAGTITVRRAGRYTLDDIHALLRKYRPRSKTGPVDVKDAIAAYVRGRHARGRY